MKFKIFLLLVMAFMLVPVAYGLDCTDLTSSELSLGCYFFCDICGSPHADTEDWFVDTNECFSHNYDYNCNFKDDMIECLDTATLNQNDYDNIFALIEADCPPAQDDCDRVGDEDQDGYADCEDPDCFGHPNCLYEVDCSGLTSPDLINYLVPNVEHVYPQWFIDDSGSEEFNCYFKEDMYACIGQVLQEGGITTTEAAMYSNAILDDCPNENCGILGDEDQDGLADCADPDCFSHISCQEEDCSSVTTADLPNYFDPNAPNPQRPEWFANGNYNCNFKGEIYDCIGEILTNGGAPLGEFYQYTSALELDCPAIPSVEDDCQDKIDNDADGLTDCADPDCNGLICDEGSVCYNFACVQIEYTPEVAPTPIYEPPRYVQTYVDFLAFLNSGTVYSNTANNCNIFCNSLGQVCGFADAGTKTCSETGSTKCTCYAT